MLDLKMYTQYIIVLFVNMKFVKNQVFFNLSQLYQFLTTHSNIEPVYLDFLSNNLNINGKYRDIYIFILQIYSFKELFYRV